jgi:hypothetical protein
MFGRVTDSDRTTSIERSHSTPGNAARQGRLRQGGWTERWRHRRAGMQPRCGWRARAHGAYPACAARRGAWRCDGFAVKLARLVAYTSPLYIPKVCIDVMNMIWYNFGQTAIRRALRARGKRYASLAAFVPGRPLGHAVRFRARSLARCCAFHGNAGGGPRMSRRCC